MQPIVQSESIHAYDYEGTPVPYVPKSKPVKTGLCPSCSTSVITSSKKKATCVFCKTKVDVSGWEAKPEYRKTRTTDMAKYGLFPSISRMATYGETPIEFTNWHETRVRDFTIRFHMKNLDLYRNNPNEYNKQYSMGLAELKEQYSKRGNDIHAVLKTCGRIVGLKAYVEYLGTCSPVENYIAGQVAGWEEANGFTNADREITFCDPLVGLGGCIDYACDQAIVDYKCKFNKDVFESIKRGAKGPLWSVTKQIAGYGAISHRFDYKGYGAFISLDIEDPTVGGEVCFQELTELDRGLRAIEANTNAWFVEKGFDSRDMFVKGKCMRVSDIMNQVKGK